ncbi:MFS transporter [Parenemella sanctibonifatiensis]|uniref:MFS transporter n=1 Tax=Parenemella sanctibonifatiensis TaxID=2016505 RepID=UPI001E29060C|nr:MFS transporter [Parenemella sanctibonifatiensis]
MNEPEAGLDLAGDASSEEITNPESVDRSVRSPQDRWRTFGQILANTAAANITTSFLWFAVTFWVYLETRNVIATGWLGGGYMLLLALTSISFGTFVDRYRKLTVMRFAGGFTLVMFALAAVVYAITPPGQLGVLTGPWMWLFAGCILIGAIVENMRNIALSTTVTILIDPDKRPNANGLVGMVQGMAFIATSAVSGLAVGQLGIGWTLAIAIAVSAVIFCHMVTLRMPEELQPAASDAHGAFDLMGSWRAVAAISGLFSLIIFSTFNNFIGGAYMALLDPYGLEMFSVEVWGIVFAVAGTGFVVGGALIGKFGLGKNPLRTMLMAVLAMAVIGGVFVLREWAWLFIAGMWAYMVIIPVIEAGEQSVIQRVVPLERQGRVFGFATAFEAGAAPITSFLVAPIAEWFIIPWARTPNGAAALEPLLGTGSSRGIALIFLVASAILILAAALAFISPIYRRLSAEYAEAARGDREAEAAAG